MAVTNLKASLRVFPGIVNLTGFVGKEGATPWSRQTRLSELTGRLLLWWVSTVSVKGRGTKL